MLLGINQGLTWSTTVIMKIDLVGPTRRGPGDGPERGRRVRRRRRHRAGHRLPRRRPTACGPAPFLLGLAFAALGLGLSTVAVRETREHARLEAAGHSPAPTGARPPAAELTNRQVSPRPASREPALSAASQAGMVNNLNDGLAWGLFPLLFAAAGLSIAQIGILAALYPAVWGVGQLVTGALSDRWGRKWLIAAGMRVQAVALARGRRRRQLRAVGGGRRAAGRRHRDGLPHPARRRSATSPIRPGAPAPSGSTGSGVTAASPSARSSPASSPTCYGVRAAVWAVAALTAASGLVVAVRMYETHHPIRHLVPGDRHG